MMEFISLLLNTAISDWSKTNSVLKCCFVSLINVKGSRGKVQKGLALSIAQVLNLTYWVMLMCMRTFFKCVSFLFVEVVWYCWYSCKLFMPSFMVSTTIEDLECVFMCAQFDGIVLSFLASETPFVLMKGLWISVSYTSGTTSNKCGPFSVYQSPLLVGTELPGLKLGYRCNKLPTYH